MIIEDGVEGRIVLDREPKRESGRQEARDAKRKEVSCIIKQKGETENSFVLSIFRQIESQVCNGFV
jgi:hypothetical protein